ncbi:MULTISPECIES: hypothetical protein [Lysinibacillus]|uniref:HTH cro/C1-type domain-containing protein n=1 Tax=Lysinibacillus capsici TaxID=2115968 RepID=A0ABY8KQG3_9BACI|nr:hypothetical protein [Lysinibacillus capsici]WGF39921.1 hypothetical protein QBO96_06545 [Lysinibacillus capsici]
MKKDVTFPKLRGALAANGLTIKELAHLMREKGVILTPSALGNKINGIREFKKDEMQIIAEILEESPVVLFFEIEYTKCVLDNELSCTI